jgi:hypothetical protein
MNFQVNTSGQFVGVAEMTGAVDFEKTLEYWQQDKWNGSFSVKWHIVKDVPNNILKHIILENNENKPVTNSRDTQEVNIVHMILFFNRSEFLFLLVLPPYLFYNNVDTPRTRPSDAQDIQGSCQQNFHPRRLCLL